MKNNNNSSNGFWQNKIASTKISLICYLQGSWIRLRWTESIVKEKNLNSAKDRYEKNYEYESETEIECPNGKKKRNLVEDLII